MRRGKSSNGVSQAYSGGFCDVGDVLLGFLKAGVFLTGSVFIHCPKESLTVELVN
jgi:hypothetical protein